MEQFEIIAREAYYIGMLMGLFIGTIFGFIVATLTKGQKK
jgi:hypothetical protein